MSPFSTKNITKELMLFSLFAAFCLLPCFQNIFAQSDDNQVGNNKQKVNDVAVSKDIEVRKDTVTFNISTVDQANWFDDRCTNGIDDDKDGKIDGADSNCDGGAKGLNPNLFCDADANKNSGNYLIGGKNPVDLKYSPCDKDGVHDDYYSTSTTNEKDVWATDKNFTVKVTASDPSGIDSIRIEWISGVSKKGDAASYWTAKNFDGFKKLDTSLNPHKTAYTCYSATSCEICVVGGTCAHPVIPTSDLGVSGVQQIIFFRTVVTDGAFNDITTGFDDTNVAPRLDKFYRFVVCSNSCNTAPEKCTNHTPEVELMGVERKLDCNEPEYTLKWKFDDTDNQSKPSSYILEVRDKGTGEVYTAIRTAANGLPCTYTCGCDTWAASCSMSAVLYKGFLQRQDGSPYDIEYNGKTYEWRVKVYDNNTELHCLGISEWSAWSANKMSFTTPYPAPSVSFTMTNASGVNCSSGGCKFGEDITFADASAVDPHTNIASYKWLIDGKEEGKNKNAASVIKQFSEGQEKHTTALTITDKQGISCFSQVDFNLGKTGEPPVITPVVNPVVPPVPTNAGWDEISPGQVSGS